MFQLSRFSRVSFSTSSKLSKKLGGGVSSHEWLQRQRNDPYVKKAHEEGYRARSVYKLIEINSQLRKRLLIPGMAVMECGSAPGAWTQYAAKTINSSGSYSGREVAGTLVACDLLIMEPIEGTNFIQGDFTDELTQKEILESLGPNRKFDTVLSDMAPNASGIRGLDHDRLIELCYKVLRFAIINSYPGANIVCKIWNGPHQDKLVSDIERYYEKTNLLKPKASRSDSAEIYIVGLGFKGLQKD